MTRQNDKPWSRTGRPLLDLDDVWALLARETQPLGVETVALGEAFGRVLASEVFADDDYPLFDKAMMDGFAVRSADCIQPGAERGVVGLSPAGATRLPPIAFGQAVQINTGAPIPPGADAVVKVEDTEPAADARSVRIKIAVRSGQHLTRRGEIRQRGDMVLTRPTRLGPAQIAAAATAGASTLGVYRRLTAAIVSTGNEVVPAGAARRPGQIPDANGPMLAALMRQFGASPCEPVIAKDDLDELKDRFARALDEPLVLAVGGMSMGTLDLVPQVLEQLGVRWLVHGVNIRPGKPVAYGRGPAGQHVFGLPGNPVSAFVCAWLFVHPVCRGLAGLPVEPPALKAATLAADLKPHSDTRTAFLPAKAWDDAQRGLMAEACKWAGSGDPYGAAPANALLLRRDPRSALASGSRVEVILTGVDDR